MLPLKPLAVLPDLVLKAQARVMATDFSTDSRFLNGFPLEVDFGEVGLVRPSDGCGAIAEAQGAVAGADLSFYDVNPGTNN